jgi:hypothetical protein
MKEIVSKGEQVCESDFPSKCKKGSKSKEIVEQQNALRIHITESLKLRIEELKSKVSCEDRINESITKTSQGTPADVSSNENVEETPGDVSDTPADVSSNENVEETANDVSDTPADVSSNENVEETPNDVSSDEESSGDVEESALSIDKVESVVDTLEGDSDDSDNESDTDCIELTTIGGEVLYYEASGNNIYRLDEDGEGVCIGSMEEVLDSSKCACNFNGKDYAIGEEIKSGKEELFRCVITNNVFKRQPKGLKYFGVCRQGADGTCTITKKK